MRSHDALTLLRKELGYHKKDAGCCHGVSLRWLEACMLHEEDEFNGRMVMINLFNIRLVNMINNVRNKVRQNQNLNGLELNILDVLYFYESLSVYHSPGLYYSLFNIHYSQQNYELLSELAASDKIKQRGGLKKIYSEAGIYTKTELGKYLGELASAIELSNCTNQDVVGFMLGNMNHTIAMTYQKGVGWKIMEINQYKPLMFREKPVLLHKKEIINILWKGFTSLDHPFCTFDMAAIVTGELALRTNLATCLEKVKDNHVLAEKNAIRRDHVNLVWIAAKYGDVKTIRRLAKFKNCDFNFRSGSGETPLIMASFCNHSDAVAALLNAGADVNLTMNNSATALFCAVINGNIDVVKVLLRRGAKLSPYFTTTHSYQSLITTNDAAASARLGKLIDHQIREGVNAKALVLTPEDIAWVMGNEEMLALLRREKYPAANSSVFAQKELRKPTAIKSLSSYRHKSGRHK